MPGELQVVVARKRQRSAAIFDDTGCEVHITMMCPKCRVVRTLAMFGLRKMADGTVRNQPWCRPCRSRGPKAQPLDAVPPLEVESGTT